VRGWGFVQRDLLSLYNEPSLWPRESKNTSHLSYLCVCRIVRVNGIIMFGRGLILGSRFLWHSRRSRSFLVILSCMSSGNRLEGFLRLRVNTPEGIACWTVVSEVIYYCIYRRLSIYWDSIGYNRNWHSGYSAGIVLYFFPVNERA